MAFDFPTAPAVDQIYTSVDGVVFIWDGQAWMHGSRPDSGGGPTGDFVLRTGDTMTGFLTANADPTAPLHYATKQYSDANAGGGGSTLPTPSTAGEALVTNTAIAPQWGAAIDAGVF